MPHTPSISGLDCSRISSAFLPVRKFLFVKENTMIMHTKIAYTPYS